MTVSRRLMLAMLWIGAMTATGVSAQSSPTSEYTVKAAFIYKFCLYVEWPPQAFPEPGSTLVIGVAGPESIEKELLKATANRRIDGRDFSVRRVTSDADVNGLHLLFITRSEQMRAQKIIAQTRGQPTLIVTESPDGLEIGSSINFGVHDDRVRFDVALGAAAQQGVRLGAQLLQVARSVRNGDAR